jgi:hypothetical protein
MNGCSINKLGQTISIFLVVLVLTFIDLLKDLLGRFLRLAKYVEV